MRMRKIHFIGIGAAIIVMIIDLIFLRQEKIFYFILGIAFIMGLLPFLVTILMETEKEKEKEEMFLEFSRNLVESVKSGTPISRSIINIKGKDYGSLTPHVTKLANQIALGIPVKDALETLSLDIGSRVISRAITLISEADKAGGEIDTVLESVAKSVSQTEKLRKERKAAIYNLVVQGYIIFFIFIVIMLVMEFKILPMTGDLDIGEGSLEEIGLGISLGTKFSVEELSKPFLYLLLVQGFFAGLTIGKLAEGKIKAGLKHSFVLVVLSYLISTGARAFF